MAQLLSPPSSSVIDLALVDDFYFSLLFDEPSTDILPVSDAKYAEELQFQEALVSSAEATRNQTTIVTPSFFLISSPSPPSIIINVQKPVEEIGQSSEIFCEICTERKPTDEIFPNASCTHSYCSDCIGRHVASKIGESSAVAVVACPGLDCRGAHELEIESCRSILAKEIVEKWDEALCEALLMECEKFYCPFNDCSAVLVREIGEDEVIMESECPICHRLFCARCNVVWHSGIECEDYQRLNEDERGNEDLMVREMANQKNWKRCPRCKFYVERIDGCLHITCRCNYQFCYGCGSQWTETHATSTADESAVMSKLLSVISPAPKGWLSIADYCSAWDGIKCSSGKVTVINLRDMSLIGTLPSDLGTLSQLTTLSLQGNHFKGSFPSMANLSLLQSIYLDGNSFTSIPSGCFQGLTNLQTLSISTNINLAPWSFPAELVGSSRLVTLYAKSCNMFGTIPDIFGSFSNLQDVRLSYNNLTGVLPLSFAGSGIRNLWLNNQQMGLSGTIEVLANMTSLYQLWLHKNMFTGPIPDLSNSDTLFDLQLGDNLLMGIVPDSLSSIPSLKNITLANNTLQGPMPLFPKSVTNVELDGTNSFCKSTPGPCDTQVMALLEVAGDLGYPTVLAKSWKNNNACSDWSFVVCDSDGNVIIVNFQRLGFLGKISSGFANLTSLKKLYLDDNGLTGSIPSSLTLLPQLQVLDVSNNNLTGDIPSFPPRVKFTTTGNLLLGKTPSSESGGSSGSGSGSSNSTDGSANGTRNGNRVSAGMIAGIVIAVIIFVLFVLFVSYKCFVKKFGRVENHEIGKASAMDSELQSQNSGDHNDFPLFEGGNVAISMQVLRQATNNFSEDNILGRGSFGVVYKGELDNGTKIAAKRMESNAMGTKRLNEFQAEIAVLTKVRHKNLVSLLGYCINGHERLLVYEYMAQGTLNQHLFDWQKNGISPLTWKQRVTIALDVARGVEYLHSLAQQSFIHRDLKPSNILLDDLMRAKVADFETGRVTTKVDVYAFGVVLMEIITGRKAVDDTVPDERSHLVTWFSSVLNNKENILMAIDEALDPDEETMVESIYKVVELARHCTARNPYLRPDMGHVVNILGSLVEQWKPSCQEDDEKMVSRHERNMSLPQALERWQTDKGTFTMFDDISFRGVHQTTHTT
ncbi:hypothetical protein F8388_026564 [Cannabis sativa]|uniref:non-specific serine/threonine protein kinase n=1 Tax=Cannabis sativa TaxID=3483 RepID=A0A7J6EAH7_CANSA|nr:hypothetical protein F8388_026564 [Cannabis sativa]